MRLGIAAVRAAVVPVSGFPRPDGTMKDYCDLKEQLRAYLDDVSGCVSVAFRDLVTDESFSLRGAEPVPSASTIKLVIMAELLARVHAGTMRLEDTVTITPEMRTGGDGILKELEPGHTFTLREIVTLMIIVSDNEATNLLIDLLGMERINARAAAMGLKSAHLGRKMMDSEAKKQGRDNFICAEDMEHILTQIYRGQLIGEAESRLMLDILLRQQQSGRLQLYLPEEVAVAHKCGDLDLLENDGGIVLVPERPYVLVVLTSQMPSNKEGREVIGHVSRLVYDDITA